MKHNVFQKWTSLVLALLMVITMVPIFTPHAHAAESSVTIGFSGGDSQNHDTLSFSDEATGVSVVFAKNNHTTSPRWDSTCVRFYGTASATNSMTVSVPDGCTINSITFAMNGSYTLAKVTPDSGTISGTEWTADSANSTGSVVFTTTAQTRFEGVTVTYTEAGSEPECQHTNTTTVAEVPATCTATGYTAGVYCNDCEKYISGHEVIQKKAHTYENGFCTNCSTNENKYVLVTDVSKLAVGDRIIIVANGKNIAMSTAQNTNNRGQVVVENISDGIALIADEAVQILTLEAGTQTDTFAFYTGTEGYLYAASKTSNNLKTEKDLSDNSSWKIEITPAGVATITAQGANTRNIIRYNEGSTLFSCYASTTTTMSDVSIYKIVETNVESVSLTLDEGVTVKVTINIPEAWLTANAGARVVFSNGTEHNAVAGLNEYITKLTPAQINDALTVKIQSNGVTVFSGTDVSVATYKAKAKAAGAEGLKISDAKYAALLDLIDAALTYSDYADKKDGVLTDNFEGVEGPSFENNNLFPGLSGKLGTYASAYINVDTTKMLENDTLVITVGRTEIYNGLMADKVQTDAEGKSYIEIDQIYPANFDAKITIKASTEGSSATFTFNYYLKALYEDEGTNQQVTNFVVATYQYGQAAEAYIAAK